MLPLRIKGNFTPFMPLCIKGKFYAMAVIMYITTAFYAMGFGVKYPLVKWHDHLYNVAYT